MMAGLTHGERLLAVNGVTLCVETFGNQADPAILLVAGGAGLITPEGGLPQDKPDGCRVP